MAETDRQQATSCLPAANAGATKRSRRAMANGADKYCYSHVLATDYVSKSLSYTQNDLLNKITLSLTQVKKRRKKTTVIKN